MKKLGLVAALALGGLVAGSIMANAQEAKGGKRGGGRQTVEQQLEQMTTDLSLTGEQKPKVKTVLEESSKKMQDLMSGGDVPREQMREKMQPIMEERTRKMKEILTAEQFGKYEKAQEERRSRMGGGKKKTDQ